LDAQKKQLEDEISGLSKASKQERLAIYRIKQEKNRLGKERSILQGLVDEDVDLLRHFDNKKLVLEREIRSLEDQREKTHKHVIEVEAGLREKKEAVQKLRDEIEVLEKAPKKKPCK